MTTATTAPALAGTVKTLTVNHRDGRTSTVRMRQRRKPTSLADLTPGELREAELCFHEAGHAIAATVLGGQVRSAVVTRPTRTDPVARGLTTMVALADELHSRVAFAGPWSQARWLAGGWPSQQAVWEALHSTGCRDYAQLRASGSGFADGAEVAPLIDRCWGSVIELAVLIHRTGEATHADVCSALGIPATANEHHLALIRSGYRPKTFTFTPSGAGTAT